MQRDKGQTAEERDRAALAYEATVAEYGRAFEAMQNGDLAGALERFNKVRAEAGHEPELGERAATYVRICERRLAPAPGQPGDGEALYRRAVALLNAGELDEALRHLNQALTDDPTSVDVLYVRACAWALKGAAEKAVGDLRQAIAVDPKVRFQAVNDPDFEKIREEPAFIDIIEPTPSGA
jgi:tetratricopeptide (TPR) repeat protein